MKKYIYVGPISAYDGESVSYYPKHLRASLIYHSCEYVALFCCSQKDSGECYEKGGTGEKEDVEYITQQLQGQ